MRRRTILWFLSLAAMVFLRTSVASHAQQQAGDPIDEADQKILAEVHDHNELMANLEYLSDRIGPRLTGSDKLTQASRWTQQMFERYGLANVHLESWTIARAWYRGAASARILSPAEHPITLAAAGWSPSTGGPVRGKIVYVSARSTQELEQYTGKLKGTIVITGEPAKMPKPYEPPTNPMLIPYREPFIQLTPPPRPGQPPQPDFSNPVFRQFLRERPQFFKREGVLAVLRDSSKPHGLLNMTGVGGRNYDIGAVPEAFIVSEDYALIWRLMKQGTVEVEVNLAPSFSDHPVEVFNTVAEIRGSEKPDEVVILGGHLDSWDLGTGATDNGTGTMAVLEAARVLQKVDLKPKRTIRFIFFTGEEQGLNGSRAYVEAHRAEMNKISGVLIHDTGTGRVLSIAMMGDYATRPVIDQVMEPLRQIDILEPSLRRSGGSDHVSFDDAGVPAFFCIQDPAEYPKTHHSQSDTFDKVHEEDLVQGAQALAVWAYNVAQLPDMLPRKPEKKSSSGE